MSNNINNSTANNSDCASTWRSLIDQLHKLKSFRIHTGNINSYVELKLKRFTNSAEELAECLGMMMANLPADTQFREDGMLLLADKKHCDALYERDDLKITLKLFMEKFEFKYVKDATESVIRQLQTDSIEQLILAFPEPGRMQTYLISGIVGIFSENGISDGPNSTNVDEAWFAEVLRVWKEAEAELVAKGKVVNMGVADFQLPELQRLYKSSAVKPRVAHVFIDGCCMVPPELQAYAQENSIQLLTHNDPRPFPIKNLFQRFCTTEPSPICCATQFEPVWAARYTVWVRRRSLMAAKGFIVQFMSSLDNKNEP